jgi:hypothetical protein
MEIANNLIDLKILEQKLFKNIALWNDENYMKTLKVCDIVKLSKKIDSLNFNYSTSLIEKPLK